MHGTMNIKKSILEVTDESAGFSVNIRRWGFFLCSHSLKRVLLIELLLKLSSFLVLLILCHLFSMKLYK